MCRRPTRSIRLKNRELLTRICHEVAQARANQNVFVAKSRKIKVACEIFRELLQMNVITAPKRDSIQFVAKIVF